MPKQPRVSAAELVHAFEQMGFALVSQRGSHIKMKHPDGRTTVIPDQKDIKAGTLKKGILNPLGISVAELIDNLK